MTMKISKGALVCGATVSLAVSLLAAQAPTKPSPVQPTAAPAAKAPAKQPLTRPIFENDRVRVIEAVWEPGAATAAFKGFADALGVAAVVIKGGAIEHLHANGKKVRRERKPGEVFWQAAKTPVEARRNAGTTKIDMIQAAFKETKPTREYTGPVAGEKKVLENARVVAFDLALAPGAKIPLHKYAPRVWIVLEGGDMRSLDKAGKPQVARFAPSQVLWLPAQEHMLENIGKTSQRIISLELK